MIDIRAIHVMSNLFNDLHFTTSLFLNTIYFCFSIFNDSVLANAIFPRFHIKQMALNIQYVTIYKFSVPYFIICFTYFS